MEEQHDDVVSEHIGITFSYQYSHRKPASKPQDFAQTYGQVWVIAFVRPIIVKCFLVSSQPFANNTHPIGSHAKFAKKPDTHKYLTKKLGNYICVV